MRIRTRLLLLMLAVLVPAALGAAFGLWHVYEEEREFNRTSLRETARALALVLDRELAQREAVLRTLAVSPAVREDDLQAFHRHAGLISRERDVAIILSDLEGRQLVNTRLPFGANLPRMLASEREFRARHGDDAILISNVYQPPPGLGSHSFAVQVPVRNEEGRVVRFLTMGSYVRELSSIFVDQRLPENWHTTIVDREGIIVARSREADRFVGTPVREDLRQALEARPEGFHRGVTLTGLPSTAFFARAARSQWTFLISVPDDVLYVSAGSASLSLAGIAALLLAAALVASWVVARGIVRPVERLRTAAEQLARDEPVVAEPTGTVELDAVARALADAGERTRSNKAELERRAAEAVAGYEQSQRHLVHSQKLEALGRLTAGIAHDFNNVLQTLSVGLQAARLAPAAQRDELMARCQRAVVRGTELARQLGVFGAAQEVRVAPLNVARHLFEIRPLLQGALPTNITLDYDLSPDLWPVRVDAAQLELAVLNLVIHARDAMPGGGGMVLRGGNRVVRASDGELPPGDYVFLALSDTGDGAPSPGPSADLARQLGGALELRSEPGQGTTATLVLPRSMEAPLPAPSTGGESGGGARVLVVEDDELVRATVSSALAAAGFDVSTAASADEALHRMDAGERFDAVLTDVVMPGALSGVALAEHIRARHPGTGVVIATGYTDREVGVPGVRTLPKPYDVADAVQALRQAVAG